MKSRRTIIGCALGALLLAGSLTAPASGGTTARSGGTSTDALLTWNEITLTTLVGLPGPAGGAPASAPIHVAMVQGAVYDAVNAIVPRRYEPYLLERRFPADTSKDAAVATAAHGVLSHIVSTVPNIEDAARTTLLASLATQYEDFLDEIPGGPSKRKGIRAGSAAADAMVDAREDDGRFGPSQWVPSHAPGHWTPLTDPTTGQPVLDPTPWVGGVTPFLLKSPSQFRTPGPKRLTSRAYARQFNQVKRLGEAESEVRSAEQTYIARWWQSQPLVSWNSVARQLVDREGVGLAAAARLFAMQNLSTADASINCWNDKYHYDFWRPWNAIPRAGEDRNPATRPQADWMALITAPYPEHPSGHLCIDGAMVRVLRGFFGNRVEDGYEITSGSALLQPTDERTRRFTSFSEPLEELIEARIWAGLHFRAADRQGKALGRNVAGYAADHYFQPLGHTR